MVETELWIAAGFGAGSPPGSFLRLECAMKRRPKPTIAARAQLVLLVDDDAQLLKALCRRFKAEGYSVATAETGAEALQVLRDQEPEAVVLDYSMPPMRGDLVLGEIRKIMPSIPVVVFSSEVGDGEVAQSLLALGATSLCPKPEMNRLVREIVEALDTHPARLPKDGCP
jgi:CheY-like chemotaxis protein